MAVTRYRISLLELEDCFQLTPDRLWHLLRVWRKRHEFKNTCSFCMRQLFLKNQITTYTVCCEQFYYNNSLSCYPVHSIAVATPQYAFLLPQLQRMINQAKIQTNQEYVVFPDPIFWQIASTLIYEKVIKFVKGLPITSRTQNIQPPSKAATFYKQLQEAPLNYGSIESRSCGKATLIRQIAFGKRCTLSLRGMIVPDASLRPNEIHIPNSIVDKFKLKGKWVLLNRMPSLQPENFVALQVPNDGTTWSNDSFGLPLEIISLISADFDGDECNVFVLTSLLAQAELATLLNAESEMGCFVSGLKLSPSQDMLVSYYLFYNDIHFLPFKHRDLKRTFRVIYDIYGSRKAFEAVDMMRKFYLKSLQEDTCFALTLQEMLQLQAVASEGFESFSEKAKNVGGCLVTQVLSGAKGSFEHLYQMFGKIGQQEDTYIESSFWTGLTPVESIAHATTSNDALSQSGKIWQPGYGYSKIAYNIHDIKVDYWGRLVDGTRRVIERDALDALHHTDVMSEDTFDFLVSEILIEKNYVRNQHKLYDFLF